MKRVLKGIWSFIEILVVIYVIIITSFVLFRDKYGYTQFGNYTFSSVDSYDEKNIESTKKGELLIVKKSNDIHVSDRIYYYVGYNESYVIRSDYVIDVQKNKNNSLYMIQRNGENVTIFEQRVLGKTSYTIPALGDIIDLLESRNGFLLLVLLPILIVFIYQLFEFINILREDVTEEEDEKTKMKSILSKEENGQEMIEGTFDEKKVEDKNTVLEQNSFDEPQSALKKEKDNAEIIGEEKEKDKEVENAFLDFYEGKDESVKNDAKSIHKNTDDANQEDIEVL